MAKEVNISKVCATINGIQNATVNVPASGNVVLSVNNKTASIQLSTAAYNHRNATGNVHNDDKADIGLDKVENLSSSSIRNTLTSDNIANGLGYDLKNSIDENVTRVYGFELDCDESDPASAIRYLADNSNYRSAHMDYDNNVFDYGDWGEAWFIKNLRPVLLKFDGTVYCELDKNDYSKDVNGNTVDISSSNAIGNVMVGIPTVWVKYDITDEYLPKFYFSATKIDDTWHAYAHTNRKGEIIPYKWLAAYEGWSDGTRMRSVSGLIMPDSGNYTNMYPQQLRYQCMNNYTGNDIIDDENPWDMEAWCDRMLIDLLLLLIGKSTDTQEVFGHGNEKGYLQNTNSAKGAPWNSNDKGVLNTGTMNTKGLFWGANETESDHEDYKGVKVFGIEHWWGNIFKFVLGLNHADSADEGISDTFIKMTPEKVNGVDYIPLPRNDNDCPESSWNAYDRSMWESLESYGYTKYSWFEEANDGDSVLGEGPGIKWEGVQYGILPYVYPDEGEDKYFPDRAYIYIEDDSSLWLCKAECGGWGNDGQLCGAFDLDISSKYDGSPAYYGSVCLCAFSK